MHRRSWAGLLLGMTLVGTAWAGAKEPVPQQNPHPIQAYRFTLHTDRAPGPFDTAEAEVLYRVEKPQCLAWKDRWAGVPVAAQHRMRVPITQVDATTYAGVVYADQLVDEDYYGLGVCHWSVNNVSLSLRHQGMDYSVWLNGETVSQGTASATTFYFPLKAWSLQGGSSFRGGSLDMSTISGTPDPQVIGGPTFTLDLEGQRADH